MKTTFNFRAVYVTGLALLSGLVSLAQDKPGNPELASSDEELLSLAALDQGDYRYTVEDYFANPKAFTFRFSPDGKYLSYRESDENGNNTSMLKTSLLAKLKEL